MEFKGIKKQILLGSILGDGYVYKDRRYEGYGYSERHSLNQKEYLLLKNKHLDFNFKEYKNHNICIIRKGDIIFKNYRNLFYPKGTKIVTKEILNQIETLGLAIWFLDDGDFCYRHDNLRIATHNFGLNGNTIIKRWFLEKWNLKCEIRRTYDKRWKKEYHSLEFNRINSEKFIDLIKKHIPSFMTYKIGKDIKRRNESKRKKREYNQKWCKNNKNKIRQYYLKRVLKSKNTKTN